MRYLVGMFAVDDTIKEAYQSKIKGVQSSGKAGSDYETEIDGKKIKLYLPEGVREQYKALLLAESFHLKEYLFDTDAVFELRMKIFDLAVKHLLIDGKKDFDVNAFSIDMVDTIIMLYVTELLLPLYHWSSTKVSDRFMANLKAYTKGQ